MRCEASYNSDFSLYLEVVLSQIIPAFRFAPAETDIIWRFGVVSTPSVEGSVESFFPKLPLVVSLA